MFIHENDEENRYVMLEEYLMTLCNADSTAACQITDEVEKDCMRRLGEATPDRRERVFEESFAALDSTFRMVRFSSKEEQKAVRERIEKGKNVLLQHYEKMERKEFICSTDFLGADAGRIPEKTVRGCFSTEKYMPDESEVPEKILPEIHTWSASPWLETFFYFVNGKYTLEELYKLLHLSGFPVSEELFREMVQFLAKDGVIRLGNKPVTGNIRSGKPENSTGLSDTPFPTTV